MKKVLTFEMFDTICQLNIDKDYVADCLKTLREEKCFFYDGVIMEKEHTASLYRLRLEIKKENRKSDPHLVADFEMTVVNVENSQSENIGITSVIGEFNSFTAFYEPGTKEILGILKTKSSHTFQDLEKKFKERGNFLCGFEPYNKGVSVQE